MVRSLDLAVVSLLLALSVAIAALISIAIEVPSLEGLEDLFDKPILGNATSLPSKILDIYKRQHSDSALREECRNGCKERKFIVGYYSCPFQAGNRLHHFTNAFIWAIVTNRTLLWKYYDRGTCLVLGSKHDPRICAHANTEQDCSKVLIRSDWIPSHDDWSLKLNLGQPTRLPYSKNENLSESWYESSIDSLNDLLIDIGQQVGRDANAVGNKRGREQLLQKTRAREVTRAAFSRGQTYLYGLLLNEAFRFQDSVRPSLGALRLIRKTATVALHSRHCSPRDEGEYVEREQQCLVKVLANISRPCTVILLSDRIKTLSVLSEIVTSLNCTPMLANHDPGSSFRREHGPFAGVGFFQDLALASNARHGFIGHRARSSSNLLEEMIVFQRSLDSSLAPLVECYF